MDAEFLVELPAMVGRATRSHSHRKLRKVAREKIPKSRQSPPRLFVHSQKFDIKN